MKWYLVCLAAFAALSLVAFALYGADKHRARRGAWRIPEKVLLGFSFFGVAMNKKAYDRLPAEAKKAIDDNSGLEGSRWWAENFSYSSRSVLDTLRKNGVAIETIELTPEERARWIERAGSPIWEGWAKNAEEKGFTEARAVLDFAQGNTH